MNARLKVMNALIISYFLFVACYTFSFSYSPYSSKDMFDEYDLPKPRNTPRLLISKKPKLIWVFFSGFSASIGLYTFIIEVPLKRNFRRWDFCLIIKFEPYLETLPTLFRIRWAETPFSAVWSWPVEPKLGGHLGAAKTALWRHWYAENLEWSPR